MELLYIWIGDNQLIHYNKNFVLHLNMIFILII